MIRREDGELTAECDSCGTSFAGGVQDDFQAFIDDLKDAGWRITLEDGEWTHTCDDCQV